MSFASIHFLFIFLPIVLLLFYVVQRKTWQNILLTAASLIFFAWSDLAHLPFLALFVVFNYLLGRWLCKQVEDKKLKNLKIFMWIGVAANLLGLIFYKYLGFFGSIIESIAGKELALPQFTLPIGISYLTFSAISYILDIKNQKIIAEKNFFSFTNYLIVFPKLIQGPITRYKEVQPALTEAQHLNIDNLMSGARRFITGLVKKVIISDSLVVVANKVFGADLTTIGADLAWFGLIAFTLQVYFDFSGYTDMAIGLGKMFGMSLPENFNYPYISKSIAEFWRRWHMTLTGWFRTYFFIPLEYKRRRVKFLRQQTDILIIFLATGLWHGASWNFVIWGGYFGLILAAEASGFGRKLVKLPAALQHLYTMTVVMVGWIFFRLTDISSWGLFFKALLGGNGWTGLENLRSMNVVFYLPLLIVAIFLCTPLVNLAESRLLQKSTSMRMVFDFGYLMLFVLALCYMLANGFTPFMYAQF